MRHCNIHIDKHGLSDLRFQHFINVLLNYFNKRYCWHILSLHVYVDKLPVFTYYVLARWPLTCYKFALNYNNIY